MKNNIRPTLFLPKKNKVGLIFVARCCWLRGTLWAFGSKSQVLFCSQHLNLDEGTLRQLLYCYG